jgi:hypothetical protein
MNTKEMIEEVMTEYYNGGFIDSSGARENLEELVKKVVKECCHKLENDGMVEVAMEMKEHFGVKE